MQHQINHGQVDHGFTAGRQRLVILAQPPILAEPAKGPLHDPPLRQDYKVMQVTTFDNLNHPAEHPSGPIHESPGVASVDPDALQPTQPSAQLRQYQPPSDTILDVSSVHHHDQNQPEGINEHVSFTPRNLLSSVITAVPPFSAVLTLWLSKIPALGVGLRPALRRTCSRRLS
jgi:hypothetical protein